MKPNHFHLPRALCGINCRARQRCPSGTLIVLRYAFLSNDVTALHIAMDKKETESLQQWATWGEGIRLVTLNHYTTWYLSLCSNTSIMALRQENEIILLSFHSPFVRLWST
jgi:hypothetical protein